MKASRGMGAIAPSKMPKAKTIVRKDKPQFVTEYKKGGDVKMFAEGKAKGKQFVAQPAKIKSKVKPYRKVT
jgi:hypothetical protein